MADFLIKNLKEKGDGHSSLKLLVSQWNFDEELIPKALQGISNLFPHYSRHDESHSKQILINIERILGKEGISKLTATDTWLILEAAYWHDIGMVVPSSDIEKAFSDIEFKSMVEDIKNDPSDELYSYCKSIDFSNSDGIFKFEGSPLESSEKFRSLMAEWFRRQHSERSQPIVEEPYLNIGLSSPRTELIPKRLFNLLGKICQMHGEPFDKLMSKDGLPYKETGLAQEDCHPRFVACLLRMGDLLDLDDNRFCPVLMRIAGDSRPELSKAHERKHAAITHLRVDPDRIEISASCGDVYSYVESYKWFSWLKEEIQNQMTYWQEIVPDRSMGLLPMLAPIKLELNGAEQILKEGEFPKFEVDYSKAVELLKGTNLYESKFSAIREIIQNSIDSTLIRIWAENVNDINVVKGPYSEEMQRLWGAYSMNIRLFPVGEKGEERIWRLVIRDKGMGISLNDLNYMLKIGGSSKNKIKKDFISEMPEWIKPSGTFGIGLQSIFMLSESVLFRTTSYFDDETYEIEMHNPLGKNSGLVTIKKDKKKLNKDYGTEAVIDFLCDKIPTTWSVSMGNRRRLSHGYIRGFDPLLSDEFPLEPAKVCDAIGGFFENSLVGLKDNEFLFKESAIKVKEKQKNNGYFYSDDDVSAVIYFKFTHSPYGEITSFFRGQYFKDGLTGIPLVSIEVDVLSGDASSLLSYNREEMLKDVRDDYYSKVEDLLSYAVEKDLEEIRKAGIKNDKELIDYALLVCLMGVTGRSERWNEIAVNFSLVDKWIDSDLPYIKSFKKMIDEGKEFSLAIDKQFGVEVPDVEVLLGDDAPREIRYLFFRYWKESTGQRVIQVDSLQQAKIYRFLMKDESIFTSEGLASQLVDHSRIGRVMIPVIEGFEALILNRELSLKARYLMDVPQKGMGFIVLPYRFIDSWVSIGAGVVSDLDENNGNISKLVEWSLDKLETKLDEESIRKQYVDLAHYIDDLVMKSSFKDKWLKLKGADVH